jgi:hypothetical protein
LIFSHATLKSASASRSIITFPSVYQVFWEKVNHCWCDRSSCMYNRSTLEVTLISYDDAPTCSFSSTWRVAATLSQVFHPLTPAALIHKHLLVNKSISLSLSLSLSLSTVVQSPSL